MEMAGGQVLEERRQWGWDHQWDHQWGRLWAFKWIRWGQCSRQCNLVGANHLWLEAGVRKEGGKSRLLCLQGVLELSIQVEEAGAKKEAVAVGNRTSKAPQGQLIWEV